MSDDNNLLNKCNKLQEENFRLTSLVDKLNSDNFLFNSVLKSSNSVIFTIDPELLTVKWISDSDFFARHTAFKANFTSLMTYKNYISNIHPDDRQLFRDKINYFKNEEGNTYISLYRIKKNEAEYTWFLSQTSLILSDNLYFNKIYVCQLTEIPLILRSKTQIVNFFKSFIALHYPANKISLTKLQKEIVELMIEGLTINQIAIKLNICKTTVNNEKNKLFAITSTDNEVSLSVYCCLYGLLNKIPFLEK